MQGQYAQPSSPNMYPVHQQQQQQGGYAHQQGPPSPYQQQPQHQPQQGVYANNGQNPNQFGSHPTLPRYASQNSMPPTSPSLSPLNPSAQRSNMNQSPTNSYNGGNGGNSGLGSRYSTYGYANGGPGAQGGAHPLSNALYADSPSSPTLAGSDMMDEKKGLASFPPSSSSSSDSRSNSNLATAGRRRNGQQDGVYRRWSGAFIADSGVDARHTKTERIGWIDGLRFIAACLVMNATFFDATIPNREAYSYIQRDSPLYIFRSFGIGVCFFLIIMGRALSAPLWDIAGSAGTKPGAPASGPSISFPRLTRAMLTRTFRFILPVIVVAALLWGLGASNATKDCNAAGMQQPYWNLVSRFAGFVTIIFNSFYAFEYDTVTAKMYAANLWTNAWFFCTSFMVYIVHMMLGNLSSSRHWIYALLGFFMWTTNNYFAVGIIGLALTDVAAHGHFDRFRKWPYMRQLICQLFLVGIAVVFQLVNPLRDGLNKGFRVINVTDHDDIQICDVIFVVCIFVAMETSKVCHLIFGNVVMRMLGKLAPGIYLLCPAIIYTIVPTLGISLNGNGTSGSGVLGVTWVVTFAISIVAAIPFHFLVELPSKLAGEYFAEFVEKWGALEEDTKVKGPNSSAPKKIAGPGAK